jgi:D-3-phosphoglycerate dehydrogenase
MVEVAVIGDWFMVPAAFEAALRRLPAELRIRSLTLDWPDVPFVNQAPADGPLAGLKEYLGEPDAIVEFVGSAEILVNHLAPFSAAMLARLPKLKLIAVSRGGPVNIDMAAARARGIAVVNAPGRNASAVAEFTIGAILAETRLITQGHMALSQGVWRGDLYRADMTGEELSELTVGVIGYGHIGAKVVHLLKPFGGRILVDDPYVPLKDADREDGVEAVGLDELLARSDVVTLHPRVTPETTLMMNAARFAQMRRGSTFINTARGPLVDYGALHDALASGHLRGAMLETFWQEPPPADAPLLRLPNVTLTPHVAGASRRTIKIAAEMITAEVGRWLRREPLLNPC